jgi:hypothetical protein
VVTGLNERVLRQRQDTYLADHFMTTYVTIVSIALGVATVAAGSLLAGAGDQRQFADFRPLFGGLWLVSMLALAVAYAGPMIGALTLPARVPAITDLVVPSLLGISEFSLFTVLAYRVTGWTSPRSVLVGWWSALVAFHVFAIAAIVRARYLQTRTERSAGVEEIVEYQLKRLKANIVMASLGLVVAVGCTLVATGRFASGDRWTRAARVPEYLHVRDDYLLTNYGVAILYLVFFCLALGAHRNTAKQLRSLMADLPKDVRWAARVRRHRRVRTRLRSPARRKTPP